MCVCVRVCVCVCVCVHVHVHMRVCVCDVLCCVKVYSMIANVNADHMMLLLTVIPSYLVDDKKAVPLLKAVMDTDESPMRCVVSYGRSHTMLEMTLTFNGTVS